MTEAIKRSKEFDIAFQFINQTNKNIFLTGKAGTGKTTFLKYLKVNSHKNIVTAAPTGVAAINAGGVTLHSLFQLPFAPYIPIEDINKNTLNKHPLLSQIRLNSLKRKVLKNMDLLVIDEVSMVASNTIDAIDIILKSVRKNFNLPFGGVQVLFIGDLRQLPPVVKNINSAIFNTVYSSYFFFDSIILKQYPPILIELKKIYRQQDSIFIELLNAIRENKLTLNHLDHLNKRLDTNFEPNNQDGYITLTTHNNQSNEINETQLNKLNEKEFVFNATIKNDFPESMYPAEKDLVLKKGAQVMFLKNDLEEKQYFNGKIGIVDYITINDIHIKCPDNNSLIQVKKEKWENIQYKIDPSTRDVKQEILGTYIQFPLRLAWGITIHKSQGLTFEKLIVDAEKAFTNGQVYVALSRVTSLDGLVLTSPISQKFLGANHVLEFWEEKNNHPDRLPHLLEDSKINCIQTETLRIFDWNTPLKAIELMHKSAEVNIEKLDPEIKEWTSNLLKEFINLNSIAKKFQISIYKLTSSIDFKENQNQFNQRLKDSATYFLPKLQEMKTLILNHFISCKTKKIALEFDQLLDEFNSFLHDLIHQLNYLEKAVFDLEVYLKDWRINRSSRQKLKKSYVSKKIKSQSLISVTEIKHINLYQQIALYRKEKAKLKNVPIFKVFSNQAIKDICKNLPRTEDSLLKTSGLGAISVEKFGEELLVIISNYCNDNNIHPKSLFD